MPPATKTAQLKLDRVTPSHCRVEPKPCAWSSPDIPAGALTSCSASTITGIRPIYQSIYVQSRGALRRDLAVCLRTGRAVRRPSRKVGQRKNRIPNMINIAERPAAVEDRAVPGNWESGNWESQWGCQAA